MSRPSARLPFLGVAILCLALVACSDATDEDPDAEATSPTPVSTSGVTTSASTVPDGEEAFVIRVEDGDSLVVDLDGEETRVRLIGINAPERGECLGDAARASLIALVDAAEVVLERDVEDTDRFGRLLRYVWVDGNHVNASLAAQGLVIARPFAPNVARQDELADAQALAMERRVGMWAEGACGEATGVEIGVVAIQADPPGRDEDDLNGEFVVFENRGGDSADLGGFVLRDGSSVHRFVVPDGFTVAAGAQFVVYVGCGEDTVDELYWCSPDPVWSNDGDEVLLTDPAGNIVVYEAY